MKTNSELARELKTTKRQISKSRKRGFIKTDDGTVKQFTAPTAAQLSKSKNGIVKNKNGSGKVWRPGSWDHVTGTYKSKK